MPGSPPISTTPPSTRPPPSTRSNSPMSVGSRGKSSASTSARATTSAEPPRLAKRLVPFTTVISSAVSTSVFHALQCGHWPCHLGVWPPHSVQVWTVLARDISAFLHWHARCDRAHELVADRARGDGDFVDRKA